jgi:AcrR family transcriptional regulator
MPQIEKTSLESIRKEEILKAALHIISENGSSNVTLESIAKAAGFSKGGITYYYSSKEVLFKEVFQYFLTFVYEHTKTEINKFDDPLDKILAYKFIYDPGHQLSEVFFPMLFDILAMASNNPEYNQVFKKWADDWIYAIARIIEEGNKNCQFQIEDSEGTARLLSSIMQGIGTRWTLDRTNHTTEWAHNSLEVSVRNILNVH